MSVFKGEFTSNFPLGKVRLIYLIHVRFDQHLSHQCLCVPGLVNSGICSQAVTHNVYVRRLKTLD